MFHKIVLMNNILKHTQSTILKYYYIVLLKYQKQKNVF